MTRLVSIDMLKGILTCWERGPGGRPINRKRIAFSDADWYRVMHGGENLTRAEINALRLHGIGAQAALAAPQGVA